MKRYKKWDKNGGDSVMELHPDGEWVEWNDLHTNQGYDEGIKRQRNIIVGLRRGLQDKEDTITELQDNLKWYKEKLDELYGYMPLGEKIDWAEKYKGLIKELEHTAECNCYFMFNHECHDGVSVVSEWVCPKHGYKKR